VLRKRLPKEVRARCDEALVSVERCDFCATANADLDHRAGQVPQDYQ
jgi:hypothetical protein